jgi:ketosteroid isomerase-like protein
VSIPVAAGEISDRVAQAVQLFEALQPEHLSELERFYAPDVRFKDPFNDVTGVPAVRRIFSHMFKTLESPRFVITREVTQDQQCFLTWEFRFRLKSLQSGREQCILGATHLTFSDAGLITLHRDYWDAAEELYEKLPLIGALMRWLKRRMRA